MKSEATVVDFNTERQKRRQGKKLKMPEVIDRAVEYLKAAERQALIKSLEQQDPAVAEMLRVAAARS